MKSYIFSLLIALAALSFVRPVHPTAFHNYASFKGSKQGQFKAESKGKGGREDKGWFEIQGFDLQGEVPIDANKPGTTGKRTHKPIIITKENDGSSPLLYRAQANNEILESVIIQIVGRPDSGAGEIVTKTITLTNAVISGLRKNGTIETFSLNYEKI